MKITKLILLGSLIANIALAVVYFSAAQKIAPRKPAAGTSTVTQPTAPAQKWDALLKDTSGNDIDLVARLRAEGFPPAVIRAIVSTQIAERFATQRRSLQEASGEYAYWKGWSSINSANPEARAALRKTYTEQNDLVRQLLGDDAMQPYEKARYESQYGNLSRDKIKQVELIARDYQELMQQIRSASRGMLLPEDKEKLAYLEKEQRADLASTLTPEELETYELRSSRTAQQLKGRINLFDASEQEYLALYKLQKTFDDRFTAGGSYGDSFSSREERKARSDAQNQLTKDIEATLGPDRYKDYKITTDFDYRRVTELAERLNLPPTTARTVVELKQDTSTRLSAIRSDKNLSREQRNEQLTALSQEITSKLSQQLGAEGLTAYQSNGGHWIKNIAPSQPSRIETR